VFLADQSITVSHTILMILRWAASSRAVRVAAVGHGPHVSDLGSA
jgi:hypothetical protein